MEEKNKIAALDDNSLSAVSGGANQTSGARLVEGSVTCPDCKGTSVYITDDWYSFDGSRHIIEYRCAAPGCNCEWEVSTPA